MTYRIVNEDYGNSLVFGNGDPNIIILILKSMQFPFKRIKKIYHYLNNNFLAVNPVNTYWKKHFTKHYLCCFN